MNDAVSADHNLCPVCGHPGRLRHYVWPSACRQCGEKIFYSGENPWVHFLKTWAALPFILLLVERKPPAWQGALTGVGIYILVNVVLWLFCRATGRQRWFYGYLQRYQAKAGVDFSNIPWGRLVACVVLVLVALSVLYVAMLVGLSYSPIGRGD